MTLTKPVVHLLDLNVILAILDQAHTHNKVAVDWFHTPNLQWALCPLTEAGLVRFLTHPTTGGLSVHEASASLESLENQPGHHFYPLTADWRSITELMSKRLHGHRQITDAYLLGLAVREGLILTTFDKGLLQLAGEHRRHILLLEAK